MFGNFYFDKIPIDFSSLVSLHWAFSLQILDEFRVFYAFKPEF